MLSLHTREQFVEIAESNMHVGNRRNPRLSLLIVFTLYRIQWAKEDVVSTAGVEWLLLISCPWPPVGQARACSTRTSSVTGHITGSIDFPCSFDLEK